MGSLLGLAALIAAVALGLRILQQQAAERARPGGPPATAIPIADYSDIDVAIRMQTCRCGGRFTVRGVGPTHPDTARAPHLEGGTGGREPRLSFDGRPVRDWRKGARVRGSKGPSLQRPGHLNCGEQVRLGPE